MPDLLLINKHLETFLHDFENLKKHKNVTVEDIKKDTDLLWILERGLYLCLQNILDIFAHIASADFNENWEYYSDLADIFFNKNIINNYEKEILIKMIGFRNRLSHEYLTLDVNVLTDTVTHHLSDFNLFITKIKEYCEI